MSNELAVIMVGGVFTLSGIYLQHRLKRIETKQDLEHQECQARFKALQEQYDEDRKILTELLIRTNRNL